MPRDPPLRTPAGQAETAPTNDHGTTPGQTSILYLHVYGGDREREVGGRLRGSAHDEINKTEGKLWRNMGEKERDKKNGRERGTK